MAKLSKEELIKKVDESSMSDDEKISFMEDISDSFDFDDTELEKAKSDLESALNEIESLKAKYKERFLTGAEEKIEDAIEEIDPEMKEEEIIDVKDIYIDEESEVEEDGEEK